MRASVIVLLAGASLFSALSASAQQQGQQPLTSAAGYPPQQVLPSPFRCANFKHNSNGSWSPLRSVTIGSGGTKTTLEPGASFAAGTSFAGVDLGAELNRRCVAH